MTATRSPFAPIIISNEILDAIDLKYLEKYVDKECLQHFFHFKSGGEHYRLLSYLSGFFSGETILDVGTNWGASAVALSHNAQTKVISFDIEQHRKDLPCPPNVEFRIADVSQDKDLIMSVPFIFLDTYHDGPFENYFYEKLIEWGYKGYLLLDDIFLNDPMKSFWNRISHPKYDLTSVGHGTGTGLVIL